MLQYHRTKSSSPRRWSPSAALPQTTLSSKVQCPMKLERSRMKKEMLINVLQPEEIRIAIVEDGVLEELYVERSSHESYVGNIYKGRIVNIEPSIQAAFVDFGVGRNGFLHVSDVEPAYYRHLPGYQDDDRGRRAPRDRHRAGDRDRGRGERRGRGEGRGRGDGRGRSEGRGRRSRPMDDVPPLPEEFLYDDVHQATEPSRDEAPPLAEPVGAPLPDTSPEPLPFDDDPAADAPVSNSSDFETEPADPPLDVAVPNDEGAPPQHVGDIEATGQEPRRRGRRRRGGRSRSGKHGHERQPRDEGASTRPDSSPPIDEPLRPLDDERPRPMDSAERRTDEGDEPIEPLEPTSSIRDEDLSFSMTPPAAPSYREAQEQSPPREDRPALPPPDEPQHEAPMADVEQLPLHEEHMLPGEPLPAEEFTPE